MPYISPYFRMVTLAGRGLTNMVTGFPGRPSPGSDRMPAAPGSNLHSGSASADQPETILVPRETSQSSTNLQLAGSSRCQRSTALAGIVTTGRPGTSHCLLCEMDEREWAPVEGRRISGDERDDGQNLAAPAVMTGTRLLRRITPPAACPAIQASHARAGAVKR